MVPQANLGGTWFRSFHHQEVAFPEQGVMIMARKRRGRGEGSIYQEPDGRWTGVVSFGINPATGKRRRRKVHGRTKQEVQDKLRELQGKGPGEPCKLTVAQFLTRWLENTARE